MIKDDIHKRAASGQQLEPGRVIGGFRILSGLGSGSRGDTFLARDPAGSDDVVLRILPERLGANPQLAARLVDRLRGQGRIDHPALAVIHAAGEDDGVYYAARAYVEGESLDEKVRRGGALHQREALRIMLDAALALALGWRDGQILHGNVKPANIILRKDGHVVVTDLGLSGGLAAAGVLSRLGTALGTANYMSPEVAEGADGVDERADMYALAASTYFMLTGKEPFEGTPEGQVLQKQAGEQLPDPRTVNLSVSDGCVALLELMLAKDRTKRHDTWDALIADIRRVMGRGRPKKLPLAQGESTLLRADTLADFRRPGPVPRRAIGNYLAVCVAVIAVMSVATALLILFLLRLMVKP